MYKFVAFLANVKKNNIKTWQTLALIILLSISQVSFADIEISDSLEGLTEAEKAWLLDDSNLDAFSVASETLKYSNKASKQNYWLSNHLTINQKSLNDGWITFSQCHNQLDPVPKIEVAYHPKNIKGLEVINFSNIENVNVKAHSVELLNVAANGKVCIKGESKTLKANKEGFQLKRGPYMRKFLDGYYPMIVEETIEMNKLKTQLLEQSPQLKKETYGNNATKVEEEGVEKMVYQFNYAFEGQLKPMYKFGIK